VEGHARAIVQKIALPEPRSRGFVLAAQFHGSSKRRFKWQRGIGNTKADFSNLLADEQDLALHLIAAQPRMSASEFPAGRSI
jgi:hypothetical protein